MRRLLLLLFLCLAIAIPASASTGPETDSEVAAAKAAFLIRQIPTTPNGRDRADLACQLPHLAKRIGAPDLDARLIDDLVAQLRDPDHWVQMCAASALVAIGLPAQRAVPAVEKAAETAHREEYGDDYATDGTGIHAWMALAMAAAQLEAPGIAPINAMERAFQYEHDWMTQRREELLGTP